MSDLQPVKDFFTFDNISKQPSYEKAIETAKLAVKHQFDATVLGNYFQAYQNQIQILTTTQSESTKRTAFNTLKNLTISTFKNIRSEFINIRVADTVDIKYMFDKMNEIYKHLEVLKPKTTLSDQEKLGLFQQKLTAFHENVQQLVQKQDFTHIKENHALLIYEHLFRNPMRDLTGNSRKYFNLFKDEFVQFLSQNKLFNQNQFTLETYKKLGLWVIKIMPKIF